MANDDAAEKSKKLAWSAEKYVEGPRTINFIQMEEAELANQVFEVRRDWSARNAPAPARRQRRCCLVGLAVWVLNIVRLVADDAPPERCNGVNK